MSTAIVAATIAAGNSVDMAVSIASSKANIGARIADTARTRSVVVNPFWPIYEFQESKRQENDAHQQCGEYERNSSWWQKSSAEAGKHQKGQANHSEDDGATQVDAF
jgi:hypothetical protein